MPPAAAVTAFTSGPLRDLNPAAPFLEQLGQDYGPVIVINNFVVPEGKMDEMMAIWTVDSSIMKKSPGFLSAQLHRGILGSNVLVNVAIWESTTALREAFASQEFQDTLGQYPEGTLAYPFLVKRCAVPGVCAE